MVVSLELHTLSLESSLVCLASVVLLAQIFEHVLTSLHVHAATNHSGKACE